MKSPERPRHPCFAKLPEFSRIAPDVKLGKDVRIFAFVNLYGCSIGDNSKIGTFVEIQKNAVIGRNVKVSSHTFICEGVQIEDDVFIGHNVSFINDKYPRSTSASGELQTEADWQVVETIVKRGASIGTSCTILCGVTIGEYAIVGAGSVVTRDVPPNTIVAGNPARISKESGGEMKIPFVDLKSLHSEIEDELSEVFDRVLGNSTFVLGPEVQRFEQEFAAYVRHGALRRSEHWNGRNSSGARSSGIGPGDEVITVPHTFIATAEAITAVGARPVFVDIDPVSFTMDPALLEAAITSKTRAIIPVHLYGQTADMDPILEIANRHGIPVVEDACQAHGAEYKGRKAGCIRRGRMLQLLSRQESWGLRRRRRRHY